MPLSPVRDGSAAISNRRGPRDPRPPHGAGVYQLQTLGRAENPSRWLAPATHSSARRHLSGSDLASEPGSSRPFVAGLGISPPDCTVGGVVPQQARPEPPR